MRGLTAFGVGFVLAVASLVAGKQEPTGPPIPLQIPRYLLCDANVHYSGSGAPIPSCVASFGITYSVQAGGCWETDPWDPCKITVSASVTEVAGNPCDPSTTFITVRQPEYFGEDDEGMSFLFSETEDGLIPFQFTLTCGNTSYIDWIIEGVQVGTTAVICSDCGG